MSVPDSEPLTPDDIFEILSNPRRRMVLYYLRQKRDSVGVKELATQIAAMENDVPVDEVTSQQRKRVYVSLYQTHLPKMAQTNVIDYDTDAGTVDLTERTDNIDRYLTNGEQSQYPWRLHYGVLTAVGGVALGLSLLGAFVFDTLPALWIAVGVVIMYVVSAVIQFWVVRSRDEEIPFELSQRG